MRILRRTFHPGEDFDNPLFFALDPATGKPDAAGEVTETYHPNSFAVLTYKPI